jgi:hypothetical protein
LKAGLRFFLLALVLLVAAATVLAQVPRSQPDAWSEARSDFVIRLGPSEVWGKMQNLRLAHHYVPGVERVEMLTSRASGVGASRRIFQESGDALDETVVEWEEGRGFEIRLHRGLGGPPAPFERARFLYRIEKPENQGTHVSLTILYQPLGGRVGEWVDEMILNSEMKKSMTELGVRMRDYYEASSGVR